MTIMNVIEYKEEGLAIIEDSYGKFAVTKDDPSFIPLDSFSTSSVTSERDRMLT